MKSPINSVRNAISNLRVYAQLSLFSFIFFVCGPLQAKNFYAQFSQHAIFKDRSGSEAPSVEDLLLLVQEAKKKNTNVDQKDAYGNTALFASIAFITSNTNQATTIVLHPVIRDLVAAGANINQLIEVGQPEKTPLICGVFMLGTFNIAALELMFELGAQTNPSCNGLTLNETAQKYASFAAEPMIQSLEKAIK